MREARRRAGVAGRLDSELPAEVVATTGHHDYRRHGYEVFGVLPDHPPGGTHFFLWKALSRRVAGPPAG